MSTGIESYSHGETNIRPAGLVAIGKQADNTLQALSLDAVGNLQVNIASPASLPTSDSSDIEYTVVAVALTTAGDNVVYTPAAGKRVRLHWVYAVNDPAATAPAKITLSLGAVVKYVTYGVSRKQVDTGPINGAVVINLSQASTVACTLRLEEV